jgi:hypothetical protein
MREVKIRAVHEYQTGIAVTEAQRGKNPKPAKLRGGFIPSTEEIEAAINWGRD